jgi:hypothetical protein
MPNRPGARAGAAWSIHSVPVRTQDGSERLDQVYRRLLGDAPTAVAPRSRTDTRMSPRPPRPSQTTVPR